MPIARSSFFLGGYAVGRSHNLVDGQLVNLFPEMPEGKDGKTPGALFMAPGLDLLTTCGTGPIRGVHTVSALSTMIVVSGSTVYSVSSSWGVTSLGTIATVSGPVSIIDNGSQICIFDGVDGYMIGPRHSVATAVWASPAIGSAAVSGYAINDTITVSGGTYTTAAVLTVATIGVVEASLKAGGTGGTSGTQTVTGTTGTGTKFTASVYISGGAITQVISVLTTGNYSVNPSNLNAEPVTGAGLSGATLTIQMGPATVSITTAGTYSTTPSNPVTQLSTSGSGSGAQFTLTWNTTNNAFLALSLPFNNPNSATYQDEFGLVAEAGTNVMWQSNVGDLSTWQALDYASAITKPDNIVALADIHQELWVLKQTNTEIWTDAGTNGFSFERQSGVLLEIGCAAAYSVAKMGETLIWLSQNDQGSGVVVQAAGYDPQRVSTHAIEFAIGKYPIISDAIGFTYQQEGHAFYVLTFPTANATWVYDGTTKQWHQRAAFSNGNLNRHWANCGCFFNGVNVVGDYLSGNLYAFNMNTLTDNGTKRKWLRSWRATDKPVDAPISYKSLQIDMETGIAVPDGTNPLVSLRWSDDGGHNWSDYYIALAGPPGATAQRVKFNRLGSTKRQGGFDRIFELSCTDQFKVALLGAILEI